MRPLRSQHTDRPRIVCFGDSITRGIPGSSYVAYLPSHLQAENHGLGGDTLNGMSKRVDAYLKLHTPDHAVLQIGTNDILHPYLRGRSMRWKSVVQRTIEGKGIPIVEPEAFTERLAGLIEQLLPCRVSVVSIPCIGEVLLSDLNLKVDAYNRQISACCRTFGIPFIDFNSTQKQTLSAREVCSPLVLHPHPSYVVLDILSTSVFPLGSWLSERRNLSLTIDGVHLNETGAGILAQMVQEQAFPDLPG